MTIETKYNIGDEVWWKTKRYNGSAIVESISINIGGIYPCEMYLIITDRGVTLYLHEHELFPTKEELLKSL